MGELDMSANPPLVISFSESGNAVAHKIAAALSVEAQPTKRRNGPGPCRR